MRRLQRKTNKITAGLLAAVIVGSSVLLTGCGNGPEDIQETLTMEESEQILNGVYKSGMIDNVATIVYGEIEKQIVNKVQEGKISDIMSPETYDIVKDKVIENIIDVYISDPEVYLTDDQTEQVRELIKKVVESVDSENLTTTLVTDIPEQTKAELSAMIAEEVDNALSETTVCADADAKGNVTVNANYDAEIANLEKTIFELAKQVELQKSYELTDSDKANIQQIVAEKMQTIDYVDKATLQNAISDVLTKVTSAAVRGEKGDKGDKGDDGYIPVKGQDYFTEEDIASIVSDVSVTFTGTLTDDERTIIVNMLADRIMGNTPSGDVSGNAAYNNIQIEQIKNDIINSVKELRGDKGDKGDAGYTPVKEKDYFTETDIESMKEEIIAKITHIPEKGVDYFTDDELNVIKSEIAESIKNDIGELSGTKGDKGDTGEKGEKGDKGDNGYTPVKGIDYFTDDDIADIVTAVNTSIRNDISTLEANIQNNADKIKILEDEKDVLTQDIEALRKSTSDLITSNETSNADITSIKNDLNTKAQKIEEIDTKIAELQKTYLDVSTYNEYVTNTAATLGNLAEADAALQGSLDSLKSNFNNTVSTLQAAIDSKQNSTDFNELNAAYTTFRTSTESLLNSMQVSIDSLENTKLDKADFSTFVQEQNKAAENVTKQISDLQTKIGDTDFAAGDYTTLSDAVTSLQSQITDAQGKITDNNTAALEQINLLKTSIGNKADTAYAEYKKGLWEAADELKASLRNNSDQTDADISAINTALDAYKQSVNTKFDDIGTVLSTMQQTIDKKLDASVYLLYTANADSSINQIKTDITSIKEAIKTDEDTISDIKESIIDMQASYTKLTDYNAFVAAAQKSLSDLTAADTSIKESITTLSDSFNTTTGSLEAEIATKQDISGFNELKSAYEAFKTSTENSIKDLKKTAGDIDSAKLDRTDFAAHVTEQGTTIAGIITRIKAIQDLLGSTDFSTKDYTTITDGIVSLQNEINAAEALVASNDAAYQNTFTAINEQIGEKKNTSFAKKTEGLWESLDAFKTAVNTSIGNNTSAISAVNTALSDYEKTVNVEIGKINTAIDGLKKSKVDVTPYNTYKLATNTAISTLQTNLTKAQQDITDLQDTKTDKTDFNALKSKVETLSTSLGDAKDKLANLTKTVEQNGTDIETIKSTLLTMQSSINEINSNLNQKMDQSIYHGDGYTAIYADKGSNTYHLRITEEGKAEYCKQIDGKWTIQDLLAPYSYTKNDGSKGNIEHDISLINSNLTETSSWNSISAASNGVLTDALNVDINAAMGDANKPRRVLSGTSIQMPSDCLWGIREVFWSSPGYLVCKITGFATNGQSAIWTRQYSKGWESDWRRY